MSKNYFRYMAAVRDSLAEWDLSHIITVQAIELGRATFGKIKQNLGWALAYNLVGIPLAAGALLPTFGIALNPSAAGAMMAFSSIAVVSNSLLLRGQMPEVVEEPAERRDKDSFGSVV